MIQPYVGEFLISPVPLELAFNYCSHACPYCFANLNLRTRKTDMPKLMRLIQEYPDRSTLTARLMQDAYPICVSNHVDPLAATNYKQSLPIISILGDLGIPVQIQTRGAAKDDQGLVRDLLGALRHPTVWYVSVEHCDDTLRHRLSPAAPSLPHRWWLIREVIAAGHPVVIGLNPCVPDWLPNNGWETIIDQAVDAGVSGVWIERLHLTYQQRDAMRDHERTRMGDDLIARAMRRHSAPVDRAAFDDARAYAMSRGLAVFSVGQPNESTFFDTYHATYTKTFPVMQDVINHCHQSGFGAQDLITFAMFADWISKDFLAGTLPIDSYLGAIARNLWHTHKVPAQMTYRQMLAIIWQDVRVRSCPARLPSFAFAAIWDATSPAGWIQLVDESGLPYMVFSPTGHEAVYTAVDVAMCDTVAFTTANPPVPSRRALKRAVQTQEA